MTPLDRYIDRVSSQVFASPADRERLESDLRSHWAAAEERGEPAARILEEMGRPEDVAAAFNAERPMLYAGFWARLVAFLGDTGVLALLLLPVVAMVAWSQARLAPGGELTALTIATLFCAAVAAVGVWVFYFPVLEARFGQTWGKRMLGLRVVRESGAPIGLGQAFLRRLSLYFDLLVFDALFVPFTEKKQRALDIVAKTVVARDPGAASPVWAWLVCLLAPFVAVGAIAGVAILCAPSG